MKTLILPRVYILLFFLGILSLPIHAATRTWTGGGTVGVWTDNANWGGMPFPAGGDDAVFPAGPAVSINSGVGMLSLSSIQITGRSVTFDAGANYALTITGVGSFITGAGAGLDIITPNSFSIAGTGSLALTAGGTLSFNGSNATINGTLSIGMGCAVPFIWGSTMTVGATGIINNSGTMALNHNMTTIALVINGGGTVNNSGTINVGSIPPQPSYIHIVDNGTFTGTSPVYAAGSQLQYTGTIPKIAGPELPIAPTNIDANVSFGNSGGTQLAAGQSYRFAQQLILPAGGTLEFNGANYVEFVAPSGDYNALGGTIKGNTGSSIVKNSGGGSGGCIQFTPGFEFLNQLVVNGNGTVFGLGSNLTLAGTLTVSNDGRMLVGSCPGTSTLTLNTPSTLTDGVVPAQHELTIDNNGTLEINGNATISGTGTVTYSAATSRLLYSGAVPVPTPGIEFPATSIAANLRVTNTAGIIINSNKQVNGGISFGAGGRIDFPAALRTFAVGGTIDWAGAVINGDVNNTTFDILAATTLITNNLTVAGGLRGIIYRPNQTMALSGTWNIGNGGITLDPGAGTLNIAAGTKFCDGNIALNGGTLQIQNGALFRVETGRVISGTGTLRVNSGGTLTMRLTGVHTLPPANFIYDTGVPNGTLQYVGVGSTIAGNELPTPMPGNVSFENVGTIAIDRNQVFNGGVLFGNGGNTVIDLSSAGISYTYTFNNNLEFNFGAAGGFTAMAQNNRFIVQGAGAITNTTPFRVQGAAQPLEYLEMNRAGQTLNIGTNIVLNANPALTLNNGNVAMAGGTELTVSNTAVAAIVGGSPTSFVSLGANANLSRNILAGGATWNFPVGVAPNYRPMAIIAPSGNATVQVRQTSVAGGSANGATTILDPMQNPVWNAISSAVFAARVQAGYAGVTATNKLGISPSDAANSFDGVGGTTPDIYTAATPPYLTSVNPTAFAAGNNYIRIGDAMPTTYYYNAPGDPTISTNWWSVPGGTGVQAPAFNPFYVFIIPTGQTATYTNDWTVPANVTLQVNNGGTLEINGNYNLSSGGAGAAVNYTGATSLLRYVGGTPGVYGSAFEFPNIMPGAVTINRTAGTDFYINQGKTVVGAVTISGSIVRTNGFNHTFNATPISLAVNGGTYYINGGTTTLAGGATVSAGRMILGNATPLVFAAANTLAVSGTGVLELYEFIGNHPQIVAPGSVSYTPTATLQFTNGWNGTVNLNTLPTTFDGTLDIANGSPILAANRTLQGNIAITNGLLNVGMGVALTLAGGGTITTTGGNRIDAEMQAGAGIIAQRANIDGNWFTNNHVNNFTLDANTTLTNNLTVVSNLGFTSGILTTSVGNELIAGQSLAITGANATRFINGPMQTTFPAGGMGMTRAFPVGKNATYLPVELRSVNTNVGLLPTVRVEAFDTAPLGGTYPLASIGNEYWQIQAVANPLQMMQCQIALGRAAMIVAGGRQVSKSAPVGGTYFDAGSNPTMLPPYNGMAGNVFFGFPNGFFAITGAAPSVFYFQSGNADVFANWNSNIGGGGSQPTNFGVSGNVFYVPNGRNALFTAQANFGIGTTLQAETGGAITVANGQTLTANGILRINSGARLTLQGTGNVVAPSNVQYVSSTSLLEYNAPVNRTVSTTEFPDAMLAQLEVHSGTINLNASKHLQSTLLLNNATIGFGAANRLRLSGSATFLGSSTSFQTDSTDTLIIDGSSTLAGSVGLTQLARLTMQRSGQTLSPTGTLHITQQLGLLGGNIALRANERVIIQNGADTAVLGGGPSSFVAGRLTRRLRPNLSAMTPSIFPYPVGSGTRFLGARLENSTTGTMGADVAIEPSATASGGSVAPGVNGAVSATEHWQVVSTGGEFLGGNFTLTRTAPVLSPQNFVGTSTARSGSYAPVGGSIITTPYGNGLQSASVQHGGQPFAAAGTERFYAVMGVLPNAPRIFGFTPSSGGNGTIIRVTGANFTGAINAVSIGGVPVLSFTVQGDSTFVATIGNGVSGAVQVSGLAGGAASDSTFRFIPPPNIGTIAPNPAAYGAPILISGSNLTLINYISIGGVQIPITPDIFTPSGQIQVNIPPNASNATIVITSPGGSLESTNALVLVQRPVITSVAPQIASTGEVITLFGQHFTGTRFVRFGGGRSRVISTNAIFTVNSPTRLSVVVPLQVRRAAATSASLALAPTPFSKNDASVHNTEEFVPITVETPGGQTTSGTLQETQFFYRTTAPGTGGNAGGGGPLPQIRVDAVLDKVTTLGALVRVTGANLDILANLRLSTTLGSTIGSWFTTSSSSIQILVPTSGLLSNTSQTVSSIATTVEFFGAYNSVIVTNAFVLVGQPRISSIQPANAEPGETITITGTNLNLVVNATIGGQPVPYRLNPDGSITITVPMITNTTGSTVPPAGALQLSGIGGSAVSGTTIINAEYLTGAPIIRSFSPTSGDAGAVIVVTGANLSAITDVLVGGIPVQSFVVNSPNRITIVLSTQASARSTATISLVTANGTIESRQNFTFTQSLEGSVNTLAQGLAIPITEVQGRIQSANNQIVGVNLSGLPLNGVLAGEPRILSIQPPIFIAGQTITVHGENLNLVTTATIGGQVVPFTLTQDGRLILTAPAAASTDATLRLYGVGGFIASSQASRLNAVIAFLRTLRGLRTLNLSGTGLKGPIPAWIGEFVDLEELDISFNELEGPLASNPICIYPNLRLLNVAANRLSGQIPTCIATRERLQTLRLERNFFTGNIPQELGTMPNLRILTLNDNTLVGSIPPSFGGVSSGTGRKITTTAHDAQTLEVLDASNNTLSGTLPAALGNMTALKTLNLSNNTLSGELPQELGNVRTLEHLNLGRNRFVGTVPTTFALLTKLRTLRLNNNMFTSIPELASTRLLDTIELQSNRLQFISLEPYMVFHSIPTVRLSYIPQDSIGDASTRQVRLSESFSVSATTDGSANTYEWRKNGTLIPEANSPLLRIAAAASADAGVYICRITSSRVPDLVLYSRAQTIGVTTAGVSLIPPELIYPTAGAENIGVQTRLVWTRLPGVDGYEVQWAEDANLRANVERRFIPQSSRDTLPTVETRISGLGRGVQIYWRVRAVVGTETTLNGSQWTNARDFKVVPLGIDLAIGTIDAGRASIGDEATGQSVAVNVSDTPVQIESISVDAADAEAFHLKTTIAAGQPLTLAPGAELPVEVSFAPKQTGVATGTLRARYRDGQGTARELTFRAIARGSGSALAIETIDFDTVRIGRTTFRTAVITNRSNETIRINGASIVNTGNAADNVFAVRDIVTPVEPVYIAAGQFQTILLAARPATSGVQRSLLRLETSDSAGKVWTERVSVDVRAFSRLPQITDPALQLGIRATPDSVAPGGTTAIEVYIVSGNKQAVQNAAQPTFRGTLRWNRQVLALAKTNTNGARTLPENTGTSDVQRITIPQTSWDGRSDVLFRFDAVALAGRTDISTLAIESLLWGGGNQQTPRQPWETQVFLEESKDSVFVAKACVAGGKRLVTSAKATTLAVVRPNPVKDVAEVAMTLREDGAILLELVNMQGKVVKTIATGDYNAGEHLLQVNCSDVASGSYRVRLRTSNDALSTSLMIVR